MTGLFVERHAEQNPAAAVNLPATSLAYPCLEHQTPWGQLTADLWVGWMLMITATEMLPCWLARLTQMPLWHEHGIFTAMLSSAEQLTLDTNFHSYLLSHPGFLNNYFFFTTVTNMGTKKDTLTGDGQIPPKSVTHWLPWGILGQIPAKMLNCK